MLPGSSSIVRNCKRNQERDVPDRGFGLSWVPKGKFHSLKGHQRKCFRERDNPLGVESVGTISASGMKAGRTLNPGHRRRG